MPLGSNLWISVSELATRGTYNIGELSFSFTGAILKNKALKRVLVLFSENELQLCKLGSTSELSPKKYQPLLGPVSPWPQARSTGHELILFQDCMSLSDSLGVTTLGVQRRKPHFPTPTPGPTIVGLALTVRKIQSCILNASVFQG